MFCGNIFTSTDLQNHKKNHMKKSQKRFHRVKRALFLSLSNAFEEQKFIPKISPKNVWSAPCFLKIVCGGQCVLCSYPPRLSRTLLVLDLMCGTLSTWMAEVAPSLRPPQGLLSPSTLYGVGILNEPHICGPWYDEAKYGPACMDDFYPAAHSLVRRHFPTGVKVPRRPGHSLGGDGRGRQGLPRLR